MKTSKVSNYIILSLLLMATILGGFLTVYLSCIWVAKFTEHDYVVNFVGFACVFAMLCMNWLSAICWKSMDEETLMLTD